MNSSPPNMGRNLISPMRTAGVKTITKAKAIANPPIQAHDACIIPSVANPAPKAKLISVSMILRA